MNIARIEKAQYYNKFSEGPHMQVPQSTFIIVDGEGYDSFGIRNFRVPMTERPLFAREAKRRNVGASDDLAKLDE